MSWSVARSTNSEVDHGSVRGTREKRTLDKTITSCMVCNILFMTWETDGYLKNKGDNESHECALRLYRVKFLGTHRALFCHTIPQPMRWTFHVPQTTQEETLMEQHFRATDHSIVVTGCRHVGSGWHSYPVLTITMYSLWHCVLAKSNASSSASRYVLKVWFQLPPSTGFKRCDNTTNIKHDLPASVTKYCSRETFLNKQESSLAFLTRMFSERPPNWHNIGATLDSESSIQLQ